MHQLHKIAMACGVLAASICLPETARAAESYDSCDGVIDSLPTTISSQGTWCLKRNLSTAITNGAAITIAANNVTIDCNDFKIGGLGAGDASTTIGILAENRSNAIVRHCNIRGFFRGIDLNGSSGGGHLVEGNRFDNNLYAGLRVEGDNNLVQHNRVYDTGGTISSTSTGILASGDVLDNIVGGVFATAADTYPRGIVITGDGSRVQGNNVRGLVATGTGTAIGIEVQGYASVVRDNQVLSTIAVLGTGIRGRSNTDTFCSANMVGKFATPISSCQDAGGNAQN